MEAESPLPSPLPKRFVLHWVFATYIGLSLNFGATVMLVVSLYFLLQSWNHVYRSNPAGVGILVILGLLVCSLPLAVAQSIVLRRARLHFRYWNPLTLFGTFIGVAAYLAAFLRGYATAVIAPEPILGAFFGLFLGAGIGVAQWAALRSRLRRSSLWIPSTALTMAVTYLLVYSVAELLPIAFLIPGLAGAILLRLLVGLSPIGPRYDSLSGAPDNIGHRKHRAA